MREYSIFENDIQIGTAIILQEGLYYKICCNYHTTKQHHHLVCCDGDEIFILGTGIPDKQAWVLNRFIPMSMLPDKHFKFVLKSTNIIQKLIPGEPVARISQIPSGKLRCCEDGYWVSGAEGD